MPTRRSGHRKREIRAVSAGLLHRVPLDDLIRPGLDLWFTPNGHTDDPEIPRVRSVVDYLAIDWLPYPERAALGVYTLTERVERAAPWVNATIGSGSRELAISAEQRIV